MNDSVLPRILALKAMPVADLKKMWLDLYQTQPPQFNRRMLESRLAYRLQELAFGGLSQQTVKRLQQLGEALDGGKKSVRTKRADERPLAGTRLQREFNGVMHEVIVHIDHFEYQGTPFKSLSSVAKAISGTSWNGWMFFGLRSRRYA